MKHFLTMVLLLAACLCADAQTNGSLVIRNGNTYIADGKSMNKKEYMNFLQEQNSMAYGNFQKAFKLSKQGWALFGTGLGLGVGGFATIIASGALGMSGNVQDLPPVALVGAGLFFVGDCLTFSGIVCLGVGYGRMHNTVDIYNVEVDRQQKTTAQLRLNYTGNGAGLALAW